MKQAAIHPAKFKSGSLNKKRKKRITPVFYLAFWLILIVFFGYAIIMQYLDYQALDREEAQLLLLIQAEAERTLELERDADYYYSDEFVEKTAREELGLVREDEILFISESRR